MVVGPANIEKKAGFSNEKQEKFSYLTKKYRRRISPRESAPENSRATRSPTVIQE